MVVSVLHKELECKVEKLKYKKLEFMQPRIKDKCELPNLSLKGGAYLRGGLIKLSEDGGISSP